MSLCLSVSRLSLSFRWRPLGIRGHPSTSLFLCLYVFLCLCLCPLLSLSLCFCTPLSISLSLSPSVCLCLSLSLSPSVSFSACLYLSLSLSFSFCLSVSDRRPPLCLSVFVPLCLSLPVHLPLYICLSPWPGLSLSVSFSLSISLTTFLLGGASGSEGGGVLILWARPGRNASGLNATLPEPEFIPSPPPSPPSFIPNWWGPSSTISILCLSRRSPHTIHEGFKGTVERGIEWPNGE